MPEPGPNLYVKQLRIRDFCGIESLELDFLDEHGAPRPLTIALADNGAGKTTLLRALALGASPKSDGESLIGSFRGRWNRVASDDDTSDAIGPPEIELTFIDPDDPSTLYRTQTVVKTTVDGSVTLDQGLEPQAFPWQSLWMAGYGVMRAQQPQALASLFAGAPRSTEPGEALKILHDQAEPLQLQGIVEHLYELWQIPEDARGAGVKIEGHSEAQISGPWGMLPFAALGDGHRSTASWFLDLCQRCWVAGRLSPSGSPSGIVLIDSVDLHLHPAKQKGLVPALRRLFPDLQLVATSQSPLTIVNCSDGELYRVDIRQSEAIRPLSSPKKRMVDTVLRGEWFGLPSTLDQESEALLKRFQLAVRNREPKDKIREYRAAVEQQIGRLFESPLEPMAIELVEETRRRATAKRLAGRRFRDLGAMERASLGGLARRSLGASERSHRGARGSRDFSAESLEMAALEEDVTALEASHEDLGDELILESGSPEPAPVGSGLSRSAPDATEPEEAAPDEATLDDAPLADEVREAAERLRRRMRSRSFSKHSSPSTSEEDEP